MNLSVRITQDTLTPELMRKQRQLSPPEQRQLMAEIGREFIDITKEAFGPDKPNRPYPWPPLSPNYQKRIKYFGPPTLMRSGRLMASIQIGHVFNISVTVETEIPYAGVHQFGGGNNIPPRPYFPVLNGVDTTSEFYELTPYAAERIRKIFEMRFQ